MFRALTALSGGKQVDKSMSISCLGISEATKNHPCDSSLLLLVLSCLLSQQTLPHHHFCSFSQQRIGLGNPYVPTGRTPYISPDKTPKCLEVGLCSSKEGKLKAMLWDSAAHPGDKAPKHVLTSLAQAEAPATSCLKTLLSKDRSKSVVEHFSAVKDQT